MERNFRKLIEARWAEGKFVCVGLDSELGKIPACVAGRTHTDMIRDFNLKIVEATADIALAYKTNLAFYLAQGESGISALWQTITNIREQAPEIPVILDAKFADIGNTNNGYAQFAFDYLGADATTVHPYLGAEALGPFLDRKDKGIFVLCRTSNKGGGEFQFWDITGDVVPGGYMPLYMYVAHRVSREWNKNGNCGLVVGATYPAELQEIYDRIGGELPYLIPGIGAQGGDLENTVAVFKRSAGRGMIINSSRGIIFASSGSDFAEAARRETLKLHNTIQQALAG